MGPLVSRVNGFLGIEIIPTETSKNSKFSIWIEKDKISIRLWGAKKDYSTIGMKREKRYWANQLERHGVDRFVRPRRLEETSTKPMCVANWLGWLVFSETNRIDLIRTLDNVREAQAILLKSIRDS